MLLHSADGVDVDASALAGELRRRKRIDLLDDCDVHPWDPRPVRPPLATHPAPHSPAHSPEPHSRLPAVCAVCVQRQGKQRLPCCQPRTALCVTTRCVDGSHRDYGRARGECM
jgi:hypothetical protein